MSEPVTRIPPRWFEAKLKALDRRLRVRWNDRVNKWEIGEMVPWLAHFGFVGSNRLYKGFPRWQRVVFAEELGSRVLDYIRRVNMRRFSSTEQMIDELDIDKSAVTA